MSRALLTAIFHLKRGLPLPLDLITRLSQEGVDVAALETTYG